MTVKRILHIPNFYPPHTGGIETVCHTLVTHMSRYQQRVICFSGDRNSSRDIYEGVEVTRAGAFATVASQSLSVSYFLKLKRLISSFDPHIIHFHAPNPLVSLYLLLVIPRRCKLIVHYHAEICTSKVIYTCYRPIERRLFRRANVIIATSPKLQTDAAALGKFQEKCTVVENVITTDDLNLSPDDEKRIEELKRRFGNKPVVLAFGRHVPYKGFKYLIEADRMIKNDCVVVIGGEGPLTEELKAMSDSPRIHFVGRIPDDELKLYLHAASVFAFPSITSAEAFGIVLLQAMYCKTPPVTFTIPASGVNYVNMAGVTGIEVENGNAAAFAGAVDTLLSDSAMLAEMGNAGRERVIRNFTWESIDAKITGIYDSL